MAGTELSMQLIDHYVYCYHDLAEMPPNVPPQLVGHDRAYTYRIAVMARLLA